MSPPTDLVCFSHLRWGFVFQRPNHLMTRASATRRVFFVEEPHFDAAPGTQSLELRPLSPSLTVCVPHVAAGLSEAALQRSQRLVLAQLLRERAIHPGVLWYYTPMMLPVSRELRAPLVVYDCMDELSAFAGAPPGLPEMERELFGRADLVFTGGHSLYRSKQGQHGNIHAFPSSVDYRHFAAARNGAMEPWDQALIPHPRIGFFGVIDERLDLDLLAHLADERPDWQLVMLGPVAKIDPGRLPQRRNLHWLGKKDYQSLPDYLSGWDAAMMPFALNRSTAFISPTKTLEYMAAGKPVVSTAIADVVDPYGAAGAVEIADRTTFPAAVARALARDASEVRRTSDTWVARTSWDETWAKMDELMIRTLARRKNPSERMDASCSTT